MKEEPWTKESRKHPEAGKGKELDSPLEPPGETQLCWLIDDIWPAEQWNNKLVLVLVT